MDAILTVGLTGDVGAGKSTLAGLWREMGALVLDADKIAKEQWQSPEVRREASSRWGTDFFSGGQKDIYAKIAGKIFSDEDEYEFATKLIHAATRSEIKHTLASARGWVVLEIPLLFESGGYDWLDWVVYAAAPLARRVARNASRGWDEAEVARRERWFMPREEKMRRASFVLENDGTFAEWEKKGRELGEFFLKQLEKSGG